MQYAIDVLKEKLQSKMLDLEQWGRFYTVDMTRLLSREIDQLREAIDVLESERIKKLAE